MIPTTKQCATCGEVKDGKEDFYQFTGRQGEKKPRNICKVCWNIRQRDWQYKQYHEGNLKELHKKWYRGQLALNPQLNAIRKLKAKLKKHGATIEWYEEQVRLQKELCAICGQPEKSRGTRKHFDVGKSRLAIDHDHQTNKVRGLLCMECNNRLAALEMHDWLSKAMAYLEKHKE